MWLRQRDMVGVPTKIGAFKRGRLSHVALTVQNESCRAEYIVVRESFHSPTAS